MPGLRELWRGWVTPAVASSAASGPPCDASATSDRRSSLRRRRQIVRRRSFLRRAVWRYRPARGYRGCRRRWSRAALKMGHGRAGSPRLPEPGGPFQPGSLFEPPRWDDRGPLCESWDTSTLCLHDRVPAASRTAMIRGAPLSRPRPMAGTTKPPRTKQKVRALRNLGAGWELRVAKPWVLLTTSPPIQGGVKPPDVDRITRRI
jgi:hypothetical protein